MFVSLNKELESGEGEGALKILLVLIGGHRKNIINVEFLLSPSLYKK
jgi:hypothetical protein